MASPWRNTPLSAWAGPWIAWPFLRIEKICGPFCNGAGSGDDPLYHSWAKGTNLLVRDGGIRGLAIHLSRGFNRLAEVDQNSEGAVVLAEAGESLAKLVEFSWKHDLIGLEFAAGIPGSVGGAIFMNAGAFRREMKDVLPQFRRRAFGNQMERRWEQQRCIFVSMGLEKGEVIMEAESSFKKRKGRGKGGWNLKKSCATAWRNSLMICRARGRFSRSSASPLREGSWESWAVEGNPCR